jgi:hypothetical protein
VHVRVKDVVFGTLKCKDGGNRRVRRAGRSGPPPVRDPVNFELLAIIIRAASPFQKLK